MSYLGGRSSGNLPGRGLINPAFVIKIVPATDSLQQPNSLGRDNQKNDHLDNLKVGDYIIADLGNRKIKASILRIEKNEKGDGIFAIVKDAKGKQIKVEGSRIQTVSSPDFDDSKTRLQSSPVLFNENKFLKFKEFQHLQESLEPEKFLTLKQIEWCNKHIEGEWSVNSKGEVTVPGDIKFKDKSFERFEVQFADTEYDFNCDWCTNLTSLQGAPRKVSTFYANKCVSLITLEGAPQETEKFYCNDCTRLTTLEGAPQEVNDFNCSSCTNLTSLQGAPQETERFFCDGCTGLNTLQGAPRKVKYFTCNRCTSLTTLQGAPQEVDYFYYNHCPKLDPEELKLLKENPDLFKKWLVSGMTFEEWKEKKGGMITGTRYGL